MKSKVLVVTNVIVYPTYGGEKIHLYNLIESLTNHFEVIVLSQTIDDSCILLEKVKAWEILPNFSTAWHQRLELVRRINHKRKTWAKRIEEVVKQYQPAVAWCSYGYWGQYAPIMQNLGVKTIMGTHNIQSNITKIGVVELPYGIKRLYRYWRWQVERKHEQHLFPNFDFLVSVSEEDHHYHAQFIGYERSMLIPNYINKGHFHLATPPDRLSNVLIMTANFGAYQNMAGLEWFINNVWHILKKEIPDLKLQLVGQSSKSHIISPYVAKITDVECIGQVSSITPYLRTATVAIVPLLHGSGTRLKILEAWACEIPVISTRLGAEGINCKNDHDIMVADTPKDFAQTIIYLLQEPEKRKFLTENALTTLQKDYESEINTQRIYQLIQKIANLD